MATTPTTEVIPTGGFDPLFFWEQHKMQIIVSVVIAVAVALGFGLVQLNRTRSAAEAQDLFSRANSVADYKELIEKYPLTIEAGNAHLLLGAALRDAKDYDGSVATLKQFIDQQPNHPLIDGAYLSLAADYEAQGKATEAGDTYQTVISRFSDRYSAPVAQMARANLLRTQGNMDEARRAYENVQAQFPESFFSQQALEEAKLLKK